MTIQDNSPLAKTPSYRADIDGLRGIAVLAVLLFHAGFRSFAGGFVGVDIFFVISGYLITTIILPEVARHDFSVIRFYERRVRRIFPALFVMIALTLVVGAMAFPAASFEDLGGSSAAVTLFTSNIRFMQQSGYFDTPAATKPLLHTWSLAVEEQFYIFFPLLLVAIRRFLYRRLVSCLVIIAGVSFILSVYGTYHFANATFYLAPTRAWELLLGAIIACDIVRFPPAAHIKRNVFGVIGLSLIAISIFLFSAHTKFPGFAALFPTVGTALIICTGSSKNSLASRILGGRPLVFVGLISYSLYLLHWPVFVFAKYLAVFELSHSATFALLAVTLLLAVVSWRFVEQPFRSKNTIGRSRLLVAAATAMALTLTAGLAIQQTGGLRQGLGQKAQSVDDEGADWGGCNRPFSSSKLPCVVGLPNGARTFILWGDSHARSLAPGLNESAVRQSASGYLLYRSGCPPIIGTNGFASSSEGRGCSDLNEETFRYVVKHSELCTVILSARWSRYLRGPLPQEYPPVLAFDWWDSHQSDRGDVLEKGLKETVGKLIAEGKRVVVVEPTPEVGYSVPQAYFVANLTGRDVDKRIVPTRKEYDIRNSAFSTILNSLRSLNGTQILHVTEKLCQNMACPIMESGQPLYADDNHLSVYGSKYVSTLFDPLMGCRQSPNRS